MPAKRPFGVYVTGTDTGIGKTMAATALLQRLHEAGLSAVGMKPVASGCVRTEQGWRNDDALRLQAASRPWPDYADVNPYALIEATAPQLAARAMGVRVALPPVIEAYGRLAESADAVVVEGVGGWAAPADDGFDQVDIVHALRLQVVLVIGLRLGCLSHARLSARAILADATPLAGWIACAIDPCFTDREAYLDLLRMALPAPCLGVLPYEPAAQPQMMSRHLYLPPEWLGMADG
ncbi:MAG: dethiobiotin synthase [Lysobacteraceae bacterium]|nr:MAG: dethiobiotin synthase [Xanthomonadaceae bacterium]